jgi:hypothetical protein
MPRFPSRARLLLAGVAVLALLVPSLLVYSRAQRSAPRSFPTAPGTGSGVQGPAEPVQRSGKVEQPVTTHPGVPSSRNEVDFGPAPIFNAVSLSSTEIVDFLSRLGCPVPLDPAQVTEAWNNPDGDAALELSSDIEVTYVLDERSPAQFQADATATIAAGFWPGRLQPFRATLASVADVDASGPASTSWIECGHLIQAIGTADQPLDAVLTVVLSFSPAL